MDQSSYSFPPHRKEIREKLARVASQPSRHYKPWKTLEGCHIDYNTHTENTNGTHAYRITTDIKCSLSTFRGFITALNNTFTFENTLDVIQPISTNSSSGVLCVYTKYKPVSVVSARDFLSWQCYETLTSPQLSDVEREMVEQMKNIKLAKTGVSAGQQGEDTVFIYACTNCDGSTAVPSSSNLIRGIIHAFGYVAFPLENGKAIRVSNIVCVDPRGNIPSFALDGANADNAKKLAKIRDACEMLENIFGNMGIVLPRPPLDLDESHNSIQSASNNDSVTKRGSDDDEFVIVEQDQHHVLSVTSVESELEYTHEVVVKNHPDGVTANEGTTKENDGVDLDEGQGEAPEKERTVSGEVANEVAGDSLPANSQVQCANSEQKPPAAASVQEESSQEKASAATSEVSQKHHADTVIPQNLQLNDDRKLHFDRILALHAKSDWNASKTLDNCLLEDLKVDFSHIKATRISSDFKCSVESFMRYMSNLENQRYYDPKVEVFEVLQTDTPKIHGVITYSAYKRETRWISPRDFCCHSASFLVIDPEMIKSLGFPSDVKKLYVSNSASVTEGGKPLDKNWVRGNIHVFGYIAVATSLTADKCKVFSVACVDPAGSLPGAVMDAMNVENCKKLALIRRLCEEAHQRDPADILSPATQDDHVGSNNKQSGYESDGGSSAASFESCLDEDEVKREAEDLKEFYASEANAICRRLTALHNFKGWTLVTTKGNAKIETVITPLSDKKAVRVSLEAECTLEDFWHVVSNVQNVRRYDIDVDKLELLPSPPYGAVLYTSYRGVAGIADPRDFCTITASKFLSEREGSDALLYTEGIHSSALVVNSVDCDDYPIQEGVIRGSVLAHGFIAIATPPTAKRIRIFHLALVDPKGDEAIPAKLEEAAALRLAGKTAAVVRMAESYSKRSKSSSAPNDATAAAGAAGPSHHEDVNEATYLHPLLQNQQTLKWTAPISIGAANIETATVSGGTTDQPSATSTSDSTEKGHPIKVTIVRASLEVQCSLSTFENAIANADNRRKFEPEIDVLQFHDGPANATISTCCYKKDKNISMNAIVANEITVSRRLAREEIEKFKLVASGMNAAVFAMNTTDACSSQEHQHDDICSSFVDEGFTLGRVLVNGYIATAIPPDATRIRVSHQWCVFAKDGEGVADETKIRKAQQEAANRMVRIAALCQTTEAVKTQAFFSTNEEIANGSFFKTRSRALSTQSIEGGTNNSFSGPNVSSAHSFTASPIVEAGSTRSRAVSVPPTEIRYNRLYAKLMGLIDREDWKKGSVVEGCLIETCNVDYTAFNAVRISTHFNCSLETFRDFLQEEENVRKYDITLETFEMLKKTAESTILYCNYKRQSRLVSPRDFVTENASQMLSPEEAFGLRLTKRTDNLGAFIQTSVSVKGYKEISKDWVRGTIHAFGYLAIAEDKNRIQVFNYACVDPSGSIPKWISDATTSMSAKTLSTIRIFCEQIEKKK